MKIIVAGSTGFVATEVIRQALSIPTITSIIALARRTTAVPQNAGPSADASKLKSVVCDDFENYSEGVKKELAGADACIWYIILLAPCSIILSRHVESNYALLLMHSMVGSSLSRSQTQKPCPLKTCGRSASTTHLREWKLWRSCRVAPRASHCALFTPAASRPSVIRARSLG